MFATQLQQCEAIRCLSGSLGLEYLWTDSGPSEQDREYLKGSALSHGEQILLRCAFDFWNGAGKVELYRDLMGTLDSERTLKVVSLLVAANSGDPAIRDWITKERAQHAVSS